jgi:hypothetical protein
MTNWQLPGSTVGMQLLDNKVRSCSSKFQLEEGIEEAICLVYPTRVSQYGIREENSNQRC